MKRKSYLRRPLRRLMGVVLSLVLLLFGADWGARRVAEYLYPQKYSEYVLKYAEEYGIDSDLLFAVIKCESNFKADAVSNAGAKGLMQLTEDTFNWVCEKVYGNTVDTQLLFDPETNIKCGSWYLSHLYTRFGGKNEIIAAYNAGPAHVVEWLSDSRYSADGVTLSEMPFSETAVYVEKVEKTMDIYKKLYE